MPDEKQIIIRLVTENKKDCLPLLLLGDEQESQIDKYLERGNLFALYDGDIKCICVVTDEGNRQALLWYPNASLHIFG